MDALPTTMFTKVVAYQAYPLTLQEQAIPVQ
jgi:hypothetical protein